MVKVVGNLAINIVPVWFVKECYMIDMQAQKNITKGYLFSQIFIWKKYLEDNTCKKIGNNTEGICRKLPHGFVVILFKIYCTTNHSFFFVHNWTHPLENYSIAESINILAKLNKHV